MITVQQLKSMEMNEAWPDIYDDGYVNQIQAGSTHKIQQIQPGPSNKIYHQQQKHRV